MLDDENDILEDNCVTDIDDYLFDAYRDKKMEEEYREQIDRNIQVSSR